MAICNNFHEHQEECKNFIFQNIEEISPLFIIEYNYQFACQSIVINIDLRFKVHEEMRNLSILNLTKQNITDIDFKKIDLENIEELNLSYNKLKQFPTQHLLKMKKLKILNLSFNRIEIFDINEKIFTLKTMNISWNQLTDYLSTIKFIENFLPNLHDLNVKYNPFIDIFEYHSQALLSRIFLKNLKIFNENIIDHNDNEMGNFSTLNDNLNLFDKLYQELNIIIYPMNNEKLQIFPNDDNNHSTIMLRKKILFNAKEYRKYHQLSLTNQIYQQLSMTPMKNLLKLNLSSNYLKNTNELTKENLPFLQYLNISNNQITSLLSMGCHENLREFYCSKNCIIELGEFLNLQNWIQLRVVDFSLNTLKDCLWRTFILAQLPYIQVKISVI